MCKTYRKPILTHLSLFCNIVCLCVSECSCVCCVCVCVREREREIEREKERELETKLSFMVTYTQSWVYFVVCLFIVITLWFRSAFSSLECASKYAVWVLVCMCVCVWERDRDRESPIQSPIRVLLKGKIERCVFLCA